MSNAWKKVRCRQSFGCLNLTSNRDPGIGGNIKLMKLGGGFGLGLLAQCTAHCLAFVNIVMGVFVI